MRYTLWSHGILVGHTDLDIPTVTPTMRQGFVEPTAEGRPALIDATGVNRVINENRRRRHEQGGEMTDEDMRLFRAACDRREALDFELRDETGQLFECEFMRVWDIREMSFEFEIDAEMDADLIDEMIDDQEEEEDEEDRFNSSWPPAPAPDERWDTMQYHLQVHLKGCFDETEREAVDLM